MCSLTCLLPLLFMEATAKDSLFLNDKQEQSTETSPGAPVVHANQLNKKTCFFTHHKKATTLGIGEHQTAHMNKRKTIKL